MREAICKECTFIGELKLKTVNECCREIRKTPICTCIDNADINYISGDYVIKLLGANADDIQYIYIAEAGVYYNAPNKVFCQNEVGGTIIGLVSEGGRKNINILPVTPKANDPAGNVVVGGQGNNLFTNGIYLQNYDGTPKWRMFQNSSSQADYGLTFGDGEGHVFNMRGKSFVNNQNGGKIMLKSPDGTKIKYLGINNNGEFYLANFEYE